MQIWRKHRSLIRLQKKIFYLCRLKKKNVQQHKKEQEVKKVIEKCKKAEVYMYLIPSMVIFSIFLFYPFFKTIYLSLYKTNKLGEGTGQL